MAFVSNDKAKQVRNDLKAAFPGYKFSVRKLHHTEIAVILLSSPLDFIADFKTENCSYCHINQYHIDSHSNPTELKKMFDIINKGNHNNSDSMTDYFDVGFYISFTIGEWDKPYVQTGKQQISVQAIDKTLNCYIELQKARKIELNAIDSRHQAEENITEAFEKLSNQEKELYKKEVEKL